jgi:hypothetical protein
MAMTHTGTCHCGQVSFEVEGEPEEVMECNCSHCSRKGFLLWFIPRDKFKLLQGADSLTTYEFNKHIIAHQFCKTCSCQAFAYGKDRSGAEMAAVNARCLADIDLSSLKRIPVDGRSF